MSGEHSCDNCGSPTSNEPMCLCDDCNDAEADLARARATAHAAGYAEAVADVDALRSALVEARNVLSLCTTSRIRGTPEYRMVSALGEELGYGAIMSAASSAWAAKFDGSPQEGAQHTCGPCEVTVRSTIARIDEVLSPSFVALTVTSGPKGFV